MPKKAKAKHPSRAPISDARHPTVSSNHQDPDQDPNPSHPDSKEVTVGARNDVTRTTRVSTSVSTAGWGRASLTFEEINRRFEETRERLKELQRATSAAYKRVLAAAESDPDVHSREARILSKVLLPLLELMEAREAAEKRLAKHWIPPVAILARKSVQTVAS